MDKSFRIKEPGLKALDGLRDYFTDVNRSDICAAAIRFYAETGGADNKSDNTLSERPFDFCREPVRNILNDSYRAGSTTMNIRIFIGINEINISKFTIIKCDGISGVAFYITNRTSVTFDLAINYGAELSGEADTKLLTIFIKEEDEPMTEREKGRNANLMGRYIAGEIAEAIGTELESGLSNECSYKNKNCVIKTARIGNNLFGITKKMHERLGAVILAVETVPGDFDVFYILMENLMDEVSNTGEKSGRGKVISYNVSEAMDIGEKLISVQIDLSDFIG